nr:hypothetical protein [Tanacetum cinerariifolium]
DCSCLKGSVDDKILVPKPPKNCARCTRCGYLVEGPHCQGCALLRQELEENLVAHSPDFQNTFEPSNASTNVVNAPRESYVVKQDNGNVLKDGETCKRCTCAKCGSGLDKGLSYICGHNQNSLNDSPRISETSSQSPPNINHCCYECGDPLDGIFCKRCTCKSCGKDAHTGYNCPSKVLELGEFINSPSWNRPAVYDDDDDDVDYTIAITPVLSIEEPDNSLSIPDTLCDVHLVNNPTPLEAKDQFEIVINSNNDYSSSDDDSLYYENIEYVEASPHDSEFVSLEVKKIVIPEDEEIEDDNLREKLLKVDLLISEIEAFKDNPTPSSEFLTKSSSTSPKSVLEETTTFHNSLPEFEKFCFDLEEISSGSTTTHSDISLPEYEAFSFYDDHIEEIRSGSTTTQSDISLPEYDSFIFYLSNDQFIPTDGSNFTHEEFDDEPGHIISPPEYDCFYFRDFPNLGELISSLNSGIRENLSFTTYVNLRVEDDYSPLLAYVVWIFLAYLTYPVIPPHLHSFGNEDTIFDPGITINRFYSFKPGLSHRCGTFKKFNAYRSHLKESPMEMLISTYCPLIKPSMGGIRSSSAT